MALEKHAVCRNRELFANRQKRHQAGSGIYFCAFSDSGRKKASGRGTLSGGEQPMLAISRALMARPKLLLLDEPSLGLAPLVVKQIFEIIRKINKENNTTIFLVEQNANLALKVAHRGYVMENGRITLSDFAAKLLVNKEVKRAYLGM
ncbi:MAG: ATP-binding cassette domain-containing protein [Pseudomonadota bacterium]